MNKRLTGKTLGMVFFGTNKETGDEEILECYMLAPWERKLDEKEACKILFDRVGGYWNVNEEFWERKGYEDFGMKCVEVV